MDKLNHLKKAFLEPSDEFTPVPFWFWNNTLDETEISRQINDFKLKGVMGFIIHPRIGLPEETGYLSDKFMELVKFAVTEASRLGMKVILYDEAMYPSGSAHGMVVRGNPEFATRGLRMAEYNCRDICESIPEIHEGEKIISIQAVEKLTPETVNPGSIVILEIIDGKISFKAPSDRQWSILYFIEGFTGGTIRGIHFGEDDGEPNAPPSGDLLNPAAMDKFIELTYERYYEVLKDHFGTTVTAMFTDEPDVMGRNSKPGYKAWTTGFLSWYIDNGGSECDLPMLWFDAGKASDTARKKYKKAVNKRLEFAYYGKISDWCQKHGISLTGHPHESDDIGFLKHFQIPGQDIVWRWVAPEDGKGIEGTHSTMGKCTSDAARHAGRRRNSNECFGCCGPKGIHWAFSCDDMKWYLDWLFVRGVNLIYPHAFYYSIDGEKRFGERPPDVGPNNIWWRYYSHISGYIKRLSWLMTDSTNMTQVAVLCEEDCLPWDMVKSLYQNQIEFNYLEDDLILSDTCRAVDGFLSIQKQKYSILLVENPDILTRQLCEKLEPFVAGGGKVIALDKGKCEPFLDGIGRDVAFSPSHQNLRVSHVVKDNIHFYLLVNEGEETIEGSLSVKDHGNVEIWDPWQGKCEKAEGVFLKDDHLCIPISLQRRESKIISIDSFSEAEINIPAVRILKESSQIIIEDNWSVSGFPEGSRTGISLESWTKWQGMEDFTGTLTYQSDFELETVGNLERLILDLGEVHELAHLYINGSDSGFKLWAPYTFDITSHAKTGYNTIRVEVTNSMANRLIRAKLTSGLLGPASLARFK